MFYCKCGRCIILFLHVLVYLVSPVNFICTSMSVSVISFTQWGKAKMTVTNFEVPGEYTAGRINICTLDTGVHSNFFLLGGKWKPCIPLRRKFIHWEIIHHGSLKILLLWLSLTKLKQFYRNSSILNQRSLTVNKMKKYVFNFWRE